MLSFKGAGDAVPHTPTPLRGCVRRCGGGPAPRLRGARLHAGPGAASPESGSALANKHLDILMGVRYLYFLS